MGCHLCDTDDADILRISGINFCGPCRATDPRVLLLSHGITLDWNVMLGWLSASIALPPQSKGFALKCVPEQVHTKIMKLLVHEVEVGDPVFDDRIFVRTSDPGRAAETLANEGVQSAMLYLLSNRNPGRNSMTPRISLDGTTLSARVHAGGGPRSPNAVTTCLELAALALHLSGILSERSTAAQA
jgi:hypothetical protein